MVYFQDFKRYCTKLKTCSLVISVAKSPGIRWGFLFAHKKNVAIQSTIVANVQRLMHI